MRKLILSLLLLVLAGGLAAFILWAGQRPSAHYLSDLRSAITGAQPPAHPGANLLLLRPQLFALDYQSPAHLRLKLAAALNQARAAGLLRPNTLVVLPEHIGTWLIARDEKVEFYRARSRKEERED